MRYGLWILGALSGVVYVVNSRIAGVAAHLGLFDATPVPIVSYLLQIIPLGLAYGLAVWITMRRGDSSATLTAVLLFALLFRLPLIPLDPALSTDVYRYLWEGKVQVEAGVSPYVVPPEDEHLAALRDQEIYPHINRKWAPTIYPAGSQLLFALLYRAGAESPQAFKAAALVADVLTLLFLLLILRQLELPANRVIIYAWNPLLIYEFFWSGHMESFMLPPLVGFLYLFVRGRARTAGIALGIATAIKLIPMFLLAAVPRRKRLKTAVPFVLIVSLAYLFYADAGDRILGFLPTYFSNPYEIFNLGLLQLGLLWATQFFSLPAFCVRLILFALLFTILLLIARQPFTGPRELIGKSYAAFSAYFLLIYPAFHPWYLCTLLPLLCFIPSRAWILFSLLLPFSYLKYLTPDGKMPTWITLAQFVPLYLLLIWEHRRLLVRAGKGRRQSIPRNEAVAATEGGSLPHRNTASQLSRVR